MVFLIPAARLCCLLMLFVELAKPLSPATEATLIVGNKVFLPKSQRPRPVVEAKREFLPKQVHPDQMVAYIMHGKQLKGPQQNVFEESSYLPAPLSPPSAPSPIEKEKESVTILVNMSTDSTIPLG